MEIPFTDNNEATLPQFLQYNSFKTISSCKKIKWRSNRTHLKK